MRGKNRSLGGRGGRTLLSVDREGRRYKIEGTDPTLDLNPLVDPKKHRTSSQRRTQDDLNAREGERVWG